MESRLRSLQNISAVKCVVLLSLVPEMKREILCVPESEYSACKLKYQYYRKEQWIAIIERKAQELLKYTELPENLQDTVISLLPAIALRILIWSEYHEGVLGLTRYYSLNFLKHSHFTSQGVIDNKTAAEDMIQDVNLNSKQKYKLACIYCFTDHISSLFKQNVRNKNVGFNQEDSKWMEKPKIAQYWTCQLMRMVCDEYHNYTLHNLIAPSNAFISCILSGSKEAVKYFGESRAFISREGTFIYGVTRLLGRISEQSDWIVFRDQRFDDSKESWVPTYFYVDILCFLLSNMTKTQQQTALKNNIKGYGIQISKYDPITVLELFLCWPYQDYFMKTAAVLWDIIPQNTYAATLLKICDKIEPYKRKNLLYGEEKLYDYKKLLVDFWSQSPDHFKRYVFLNSPITYWNPVEVATTTGIGLLLKLLSLKKFTYEDEEIIWLILESATDEEKGNLTSAKWWSSTCISLLKKEKFEIFDRLLLLLCKSEQETIKFKNELNIHEAGYGIFSHFLSYGKVNAVKSLIKRVSVPDGILWSLKGNIMYSDAGMQHCLKLLSSNRYKDFEEFVNWFLPSNQREYKKALSLDVAESFPVHHFDGEREVRNFLTSFTTSKLPNREAIKGIKTSVADTFGLAICEDLIAGSSTKITYEEKNSSVRVKSEFTGGQWGRVDEFLRWSLSTEMKIREFKTIFYKSASIEDIHFQLIKVRQWKVAERFLQWLSLTCEEIKSFKKRMLFTHNATWRMFHYLVFAQDDEMHNVKTIDLFLRWHLTDKESIIEFRDYFFDSHEDFDEAGLKKFNSLIENYLDDLDQAEICSICGNAESRFFRILAGGCEKRKSSVFPPIKKLRFSKYDEVNHQNKNGCLNRRRSRRLLNRSRKA